MNRFRAWALGALVAVPLVGVAQQAQAAAVWLCAPEAVATAAARRVVNPNTNNAYGLNAAGCALIQQADIGYFQTQGFTSGPGQNSILFTTGVVTGATTTTNFVIGTLPAKSYIQQIIFSNAAAAAVAGGVSIGSTANGTQIVAAQAVGAATPPATADVAVPQASILLSGVSATGVATTLNMAAVTGWNGANVTVTVIYGAY